MRAAIEDAEYLLCASWVTNDPLLLHEDSRNSAAEALVDLTLGAHVIL